MKRLLLFFAAITIGYCSFGQTSGEKSSPVVNRTWSGAAFTTNWNTPGNWVGGIVPASSDNVVIPLLTGGGYQYPNLIAGTVISCTNLTLNNGASLFVSSGGALTINGKLSIATTGNMVIKSQGSVITNGAVSGKATVQRIINPDLKWHFLSSPVSGQKICNGIFAPTFPGTFPGNIATWDFYNWLPNCPTPPNEHWRNLRNPDGTVNTVDFPLLAFADSRGYLVAYGSGWTTTKNFIGPLNTADRVLAFYDLITDCSWALPGNPFPSAVDWSLVEGKENLTSPYYYIWNDVTGNYEFWMDNFHGSANADGFIPAMQGFFIQVNVNGEKNLYIPNSARAHHNDVDYWLKETPANKLSIKLSNGTNYNDETFVMFENNSTTGRDRTDAEKLFSLNKNVPQIYTIIDNNYKSCLNSMPNVENGATIPIGIIAPVDGDYSFSVNGIESFSSLTGLSLEDLKMNTTQDLLQNPVYKFSATGIEDAGRFLLHFAGAIGVNEKSGNPVNIFSHEKTIFITSTSGLHNAHVTVSNMLGQEIVTQNLGDQTSYQVRVNARTGYYIVKVQDESMVKTAKVYVN
jgi:hypothetical protein